MKKFTYETPEIKMDKFATDSIMDESSVNPDPVNCDDVGKAGPAVTPFLGF